MYVSDTVEAAIVIAKNLKPGHLPLNVSSGERLNVSRIAELVCQELGLSSVRMDYTESERGWAGDVVGTDLDITLLKSKGWKPKVTIENGVKRYIEWLVKNYGPVKEKN